MDEKDQTDESPEIERENTAIENNEEEITEEAKSPIGDDSIQLEEPLEDNPVTTEEGDVEQHKLKSKNVTQEANAEPASETEGGNSVAGVTTGGDLPSSNTFEVGEAPEMKPLVGMPLSRTGSIDLEECEVNENEDGFPNLDLGTPERETTSPVQKMEEKDKSPSPAEDKGSSIDYEEHKEHLRELQAEKDKLSQLNNLLQMKLVDYFRKKTGDEVRPEKDKGVSDQEQRYQKYMSTMEDLKQQYRRDSESFHLQTEELKKHAHDKLSQVNLEWNAFMALKREVAVKALSLRQGKTVAQAEVEKIQAAEQRHEDELTHVRLENIKLKNKVLKFEATLRAKEELAEGLHLIDFEQLKIENQTYNEKIEERNEELLKLRKKITSTVQVLTHVKEKLQFVQNENQAKRAQLFEVEAVVARKRDVLTRTKQSRDGLRADNLRLRQRSGLLGNETLLRDFEGKVDASEALEQRLEGLKRRHAELILKCAGVKKKLEQARSMASQ